MSGYTKLFGSILVSTVWELPLQSKIVWVTMLAMADWHGEVLASVPGLAKMAGVSREECEAALAAFLAPDPDSRSKEDDGRRIREIDGGWYLINHRKYTQQLSPEDRRERTAERVRRWREKRAVTLGNAQTRVATDGDESNDIQTQTQTTDPDLGANGSIQENAVEKTHDPSAAPTAGANPPAEFMRFWSGITSPRRKGERAEALEAWRKAGKPKAEYLIRQWRAYLASLGETLPKDVCRWLKKGIFHGPFESGRSPMSKLGVPERPDPNCKGWHAGGKNTGKRNPRGQQAGCPECKSVYLRSWTEDDRPGEPTPVGNLFPGGQR